MFTTQGEAAQEALFDLTAAPEAAHALRDLRWLRGQAERGIEHQVAVLRACGQSWAYIGVMLGVSKQAAQQRYGGE